MVGEGYGPRGLVWVEQQVSVRWSKPVRVRPSTGQWPVPLIHLACVSGLDVPTDGLEPWSGPPHTFQAAGHIPGPRSRHICCK